MSHANLEEVTDGMAAQRAYLEIITPGTDHDRQEDLRKKLLNYCGLDTMAMVMIAEVLARSPSLSLGNMCCRTSQLLLPTEGGTLMNGVFLSKEMRSESQAR